MRNIQIDLALRKAWELGANYRADHDAGFLSSAEGYWSQFEKYIADIMVAENGNTDVLKDAKEMGL